MSWERERERWGRLRMIKSIWIVFGCSLGRQEALESLENTRGFQTKNHWATVQGHLHSHLRDPDAQALLPRQLIEWWAMVSACLHLILAIVPCSAVIACEVFDCLKPAHAQIDYLQPSANVINALIQSIFQSLKLNPGIPALPNSSQKMISLQIRCLTCVCGMPTCRQTGLTHVDSAMRGFHFSLKQSQHLQHWQSSLHGNWTCVQVPSKTCTCSKSVWRCLKNAT